MEEKRPIILRLAATVNLGNYENLRAEIEVPLVNDTSIESCRQTLADIIREHGDYDPQIKQCCESYARRVLDQKPIDQPAPEKEHIEEAVTVCHNCGIPITQLDINRSNIFSPGRIPLCKKCLEEKK